MSDSIAGMDAVTHPPHPVNEPNLTYAPGSPERDALLAEVVRQERRQVSLRAHIGGRRRNGGGAEIKVVQPHDHQHVLGVMKNSTTRDAEAAVKAAGTQPRGGMRCPSTTGRRSSSRRPTCSPARGANG